MLKRFASYRSLPASKQLHQNDSLPVTASREISRHSPSRLVCWGVGLLKPSSSVINDMTTWGAAAVQGKAMGLRVRGGAMALVSVTSKFVIEARVFCSSARGRRLRFV